MGDITAYRLNGDVILCPDCADGVKLKFMDLARLDLGTECSGCGRIFTLYRGPYEKNRTAQWIKDKDAVKAMKEAIEDDDQQGSA